MRYAHYGLDHTQLRQLLLQFRVYYDENQLDDIFSYDHHHGDEL